MTIFNYNESTYLQENPDVAQAVASGIIPNGFEHWVKFGFIEKRTSRIFLLALCKCLIPRAVSYSRLLWLDEGLGIGFPV
ncbi:hypothetical protein QUA81_13275 [Microcoleus sp. F6_B4]